MAFKIIKKGGHANLVQCPECKHEYYLNPMPEYHQHHYYIKDHKETVFICQNKDCNYESSEFIDCT